MKVLLIRDAVLVESLGRDTMIGINNDGQVEIVKIRDTKRTFNIETIEEGDSLIS